MFCKNANRLLLQFHITGRCNLRCRHCYRTEGDTEPLSFSDVVSVIEQYEAAKERYNKLHGIRRKGHINITGGEPFFRKDIGDILRMFGEKRDSFSYGVLSNGSFLNDENITLLKETGVSFLQLSIDGNRETHDSLRAEGDYDRTFSVASKLVKSGIRTYISFTAHAENYRDFIGVAKECRKRRITKLWSDRLVPIGTGEGIRTVDKDLLEDYVKTMKKAKGGFLVQKLFPHTEISMNRALQFTGGGDFYSCSAGDSLITVDEFGNIMPCRRMPVICGNIWENTIEDVYFNHEVFRSLRKPYIPEACRRCDVCTLCRGGAKCQSYAVYGDFKREDPGCPYTL